MDPGMTTRSAIDSFTEIATLRIELMGSDPLIDHAERSMTSSAA